jgi:hypothetical protein
MIKEDIRVYKDLKFMLLRLIHDYYGFKVKWLILGHNGLEVEDDEILFWSLIYGNYSLVLKLWKIIIW